MSTFGNFDHATMAEAFSAAGNDPRQWTSYGTVEDTPVEFDTEYGQPFVTVRLHPAGNVVRARVLSQFSGNGEGSWTPFVENDEVLVSIPEGDERAGCVILGRLNNSYDAFPRQVAGQDSTQNTFAFHRTKTPMIIETASSYLIRSATSGAFLGIDPTGSATISDGNNNMLHVGADFVGIASGDSRLLLQLDLQDNQVIASVNNDTGGTKMILDVNSSSIYTGGTLSIGTAGAPASQHAVSLEQVVSILANLICALTAQTAFSTSFMAAWAIGAPALLETIFTAALAGTISPSPPGPAPGGNIATLIPQISAALAGQIPDPTGVVPGVGRAGLLI